MKKLAVYAGTFDPVTYGHMDLVERAARTFDQIIVAVGCNMNKKTLFSLEERVDLTAQALQHCKNVTVKGFSGLLLNFMQQESANIILRGLRAPTDFDYEFQMACMHRFLNPAIESVFLMPAEKFMYLSSTLVREIATLKGDVSGFVPEVIVKALEKKLQ
jgi:pantetheine-phosphate adenylyltransferase